MAKKEITKKNDKAAKQSTAVSELETKIQNDLNEKVKEATNEIVEKFESLGPSEDIINDIMSNTEEQAEMLVESEVNKINELQKEVENAMKKIVDENPNVIKLEKKVINSKFTNFWNGVEY